MGQITGGRVVYGRTVQPAQYESKKAEVEITFAVAEGEDHAALLDLAAKVACDKAHEMVGLKPIAKSAVAASEPKSVGQGTAITASPGGNKEAAAAAMNAKDTKAEPEKRKPGRPPRVPVDPAALDDDAKGHQAKMDESNPAKANISTGEARVDPAQEDDDLLGDIAPAAQDITDRDITDAVTKKNAKLKQTHQGEAPGMIRALIASYFPAGAVASCAKLPKDVRADFLKKLEAMT